MYRLSVFEWLAELCHISPIVKFLFNEEPVAFSLKSTLAQVYRLQVTKQIAQMENL